MTLTKILTAANWGGNVGIRLPKDFAEIVGISNKTKVLIKVVDNAIIITPANPPRSHIPLAERMNRALSDGSRDGEPYAVMEEDKEWLDMPPGGEEYIW